MSKGDPLAVLLEVNASLALDVDEHLITACYQLQKEHQYDKDRHTVTKMGDLIEDFIANEDNGGSE